MILYSMPQMVKNIGSRYMLVNVVARRAREIAMDAEENQLHLTEKPVTMALDEVKDGKLTVQEEE